MNEITKNSSGIAKLSMLLLALCPILSMYGSFLNYAIWSFLLLIVYIIIKTNGKNVTLFPKCYMLYWTYLAIDYLILTRKIGAIIPGGLNFFVFSIILGFISKQFDVYYYRKYMRFLVLITSVLFIGQEIMWYTTGSRFVPLLPLGNLTTTISYSEMVTRNLYLDRSASIFFEPAHFANFLLMGLVVEIGVYKGKKILSGFAIFIVIILLLLRSGTGLAGLSVITIFKMCKVLQRLSFGKRLFALLTMIIIIGGAVYYYIQTEIGAGMYERTQNELTIEDTGKSYGRFVTGSLIYKDLPLISKIIGASKEDIIPIAQRYTFGNVSEVDDLLYMNGWAYVLNYTGFLGLFLLIVVLIKLYRTNQDIAKCGIWLFVAVSFFEQSYTQPIMLVMLIISTYYQNNKSIIINE